jgi:hypothetical protein
MEVHAYPSRSVESGRQCESLTETAVLARPGYQDALARDAAAKLVVEAETVRLHRKGHRLSPGDCGLPRAASGGSAIVHHTAADKSKAGDATAPSAC